MFPLIGCGRCRYCGRGNTQQCDSWTLIGVQRDGGLAERVAVPEASLVELPGELTWEQSAFVEPFANSIGAWDKVSIGTKDNVLVIGAGGLGLVARASRSAMDQSVEIIDPSDPRVDAAEELGATRCVDDRTRRFDYVFDTVGSAETRALALAVADKGGTVVLLGFAAPIQELPANEVIRHEQHVVGSFVYNIGQFRQAVDLARVTADSFVTSLGWHDVPGALVAFERGDHNVVKAVLRPG